MSLVFWTRGVFEVQIGVTAGCTPRDKRDPPSLSPARSYKACCHASPLTFPRPLILAPVMTISLKIIPASNSVDIFGSAPSNLK